MTYACFVLHVNALATGFLYLLVIVVTALHPGFAAATAASLFAFVCLDYFFLPPLFKFYVIDPADWVALLTFEFTALIVSRLSSQAKEQALIAEKQRADRQKLYQLSRGVLLSDPLRPMSSQVLGLIRDILNVESAAIFDGIAGTCHGVGSDTQEVETLAGESYTSGRDYDDLDRGAWSRVLRLGGNSIGSLAIRSKDISADVATAVASLTVIALEHSRALDRAAQAEASRHGEQLRSAVLDSLAHAFKTPLTTIRAASSGLLEMGTLQGVEATLVGLIDQESERLSNLASQLLRTARLEKMPFKPHGKCDLNDIVEMALKDLAPQMSANVISVHLPEPPIPLRGDRELVAMGLMQLFDNAAKYSAPGSEITISAEKQAGMTVIAVHNWGPVIRPEDRERIFDRFYRAPGTQHLAAGTGIGLSITRRAAEAHGGRCWVESTAENGTTFFFSICNQRAREAGQPGIAHELTEAQSL